MLYHTFPENLFKLAENLEKPIFFKSFFNTYKELYKLNTSLNLAMPNWKWLEVVVSICINLKYNTVVTLYQTILQLQNYSYFNIWERNIKCTISFHWAIKSGWMDKSENYSFPPIDYT